MRYITVVLLLLVGYSVCGQDDWRDDMLGAHNRRRINHGLPRLDMRARLNEAAQGHAEMMAVVGRMSHTLFGMDAGDRLRRVEYNWWRWGENIAAGYDKRGDVMRAWMHSPGHRANILSPWFEHVGFGYAEDERGHPYWCVVFATPR